MMLVTIKPKNVEHIVDAAVVKLNSHATTIFDCEGVIATHSNVAVDHAKHNSVMPGIEVADRLLLFPFAYSYQN